MLSWPTQRVVQKYTCVWFDVKSGCIYPLCPWFLSQSMRWIVYFILVLLTKRVHAYTAVAVVCAGAGCIVGEEEKGDWMVGSR